MRKKVYAAFILIFLLFAISIYFYPRIPERMASHWDFEGKADGTMPRFWGLFLIPVISLICIILFLVFPRFDPLKKNVWKFLTYYDGFILSFVLFMLVLQSQIILWNLGIQVSMNLVMSFLFAGLFLELGVLLENSKRNWFIGIRTPWTLSSDYVWEKTHKLGANLFKASGIICLLGIFLGRYAFLFLIGPVLISTVWTVVYSYLVFREHN